MGQQALGLGPGFFPHFFPQKPVDHFARILAVG
uniref:Uncharacterized protein n=1 Tax=Arundo donax TaxID=35708 RepID=A0A0A8YPR6_ARUDO